MKNKLLYLLIVLLPAGHEARAQFSQRDFDAIAILLGKWQMPRDGGMLYEVWEKTSDALFRGRSFTVQGQDTIPEETVEISRREGIVRYSPSVARQNAGLPVDFVLRSFDDSGLLFENQEHDFPQSIRYFPLRDSMTAIISGHTATGYRESKFHYTRIPGSACDPMDYFAGRWRLKAWTKGRSAAPPDITAYWQLRPSPEGEACLRGSVVLSGNDTFTNEWIGSLTDGGLTFHRNIRDRSGNGYQFSSRGWQGDHLTWLGSFTPGGSLGGSRTNMKQEIRRMGPDRFLAVFYTLENGQWIAGMEEELERVLETR